MSSTTIAEAGFNKKGGTLCSPRISTEDMKLMDVSFSVDPFNQKISTNGIEGGDIYDS